MQQGFTMLRKLGFTMQQLRALGTTSDAHVTLDQHGVVLGMTGRARWKSADNDNIKRFNIQVPRQKLRQVLYDELPPETVQWGKKLIDINANEQMLSFDDGSSAVYDLIVAADGIWSQFTRHHPLSYLGVIVILGRGTITTSNELNLGVDKIWQTVDGTTRMYAMPFGSGGETMWQLSWRCSEEQASALSGRPEALLQEAMCRAAGWHAPWAELLHSTRPCDVTGYPAYDKCPVPDYSLPGALLLPRVAVLGDAAHPLSPFKGQGANQALIDAVELASILAAGHGSNNNSNSNTSTNTNRSSEVNANTNSLNTDDVGSAPGEGGGSSGDSSGAFATAESILADVDIAAMLGRFHRGMHDRVGEKVRGSREAAGVLHSPQALARGDCTRGKARGALVTHAHDTDTHVADILQVLSCGDGSAACVGGSYSDNGVYNAAGIDEITCQFKEGVKYAEEIESSASEVVAPS
jgi:2-polyprenyl-6-methoxyphenol hydroxylase-like FAD-dependent oxidoreductase